MSKPAPKRAPGKRGDLLAKLEKAVNAKLGGQVASRLGAGIASDVVRAIPSGVEVIDRYLLACGGAPVGQAIEIYGDPDVGKTSLALAFCVGAQKLGATVVYCDTEATLQGKRAKALGINVDDVVVVQPDSAEATVDAMKAALETLPDGGLALLVWDSIAASGAKEEVETGKAHFGGASKTVHLACRVLHKLAMRKGVAMVFVNQQRTKLGVAFGNPIFTPGGDGPKYLSVARLWMLGGQKVKERDGVAGKDVKIKLVKSKLRPPNVEATVRFMFAGGFDDAWTTLELAKDLALVKQDSRGEAAVAEAREKLEWIP